LLEQESDRPVCDNQIDAASSRALVLQLRNDEATRRLQRASADKQAHQQLRALAMRIRNEEAAAELSRSSAEERSLRLAA